MSNLVISAPYWAAFFLAMIPGTELRASIPVVLALSETNPFLILIISVIGSVIPAFVIIWGLGGIYKFCESYLPFLARIIDRILKRTRLKTDKKVMRYGLLALLFFVAIPFPGTGVWTGSFAAWIFGLPKKKSFMVITVGSFIAGMIVTFAFLGIIKIL